MVVHRRAGRENLTGDEEVVLAHAEGVHTDGHGAETFVLLCEFVGGVHKLRHVGRGNLFVVGAV